MWRPEEGGIIIQVIYGGEGLTKKTERKGLEWQQAHRLVLSVGRWALTVGDEWEGIIYSLGQIIAPFGPELENSF